MNDFSKVYEAMLATCNGDPRTQHLQGWPHIYMVYHPGKLFWHLSHVCCESIPNQYSAYLGVKGTITVNCNILSFTLHYRGVTKP